MLRCVASVVIFGAVGWGSVSQADDFHPRQMEPTDAELVVLIKKMYVEYDNYYTQAEKINDKQQRDKYFADHDPATKYVPLLTEFEHTHHGTHAGLMAVRKIIHLGAGGGEFDNPRDLGRRHALKVLKDYASAAELPEIIRYLDTGNFEPESETLLRHLMNDTHVRQENRMFAKYMLARWSLTARNAHQNWERRRKELAEGQAPQYPKEKEYLTAASSSALPPEKLAKLEHEAIEILNSLSTSNSEVRQPGVKGIDEHWHVIRFDPDKTKTMPLVKELSAGLLFKEQHLREGKPAPDLNLQLVTGEQWSLTDQQGKTVIIQFSFKGCGPCEAMYPDLRELAAAHKEKLVILSIMADEKQADTTDAVKSRKITWNVHWDGDKGPVAPQWAVNGFPTVYVVGPDGRIVTNRHRGEKLKTKIAELTR